MVVTDSGTFAGSVAGEVVVSLLTEVYREGTRLSHSAFVQKAQRFLMRNLCWPHPWERGRWRPPACCLRGQVRGKQESCALVAFRVTDEELLEGSISPGWRGQWNTQTSKLFRFKFQFCPLLLVRPWAVLFLYFSEPHWLCWLCEGDTSNFLLSVMKVCRCGGAGAQ